MVGPPTDVAGLKTSFLALPPPILGIGRAVTRPPSLRELDNAPEVAVDAGP